MLRARPDIKTGRVYFRDGESSSQNDRHDSNVQALVVYDLKHFTLKKIKAQAGALQLLPTGVVDHTFHHMMIMSHLN